jgi:hypothetical protein
MHIHELKKHQKIKIYPIFLYPKKLQAGVLKLKYKDAKQVS